MSKTLYIGNLPFEYSEDSLHSLFEQHGKVKKTNLIIDSYSGRSKGFGFVEMENDGEAATAIANLNGTAVGGRNIVVNEARPRTENRSGGREKSAGRRW